MDFRIAFLNCKSLFEIGQHASRSLKTDAALQRKIRDLASALRRAFAPHMPDLVGLSEVGARGLAHDVLSAVDPGRYSIVWQEPPAPFDPLKPQTGLALGYNAQIFDIEEEADGEATPGEDSRYHWLAVRVRLRLAGRNVKTFWAVVNHWPSDFGSGATRGAWPRALVSKILAEFLGRRLNRGYPALLLVGDFNCEPFDAPMTGDLLSGERLIAIREHHRALNPRARLPYLYNLMWRALGEPLPIEDRLQGSVSRRPPGTYADLTSRGSQLLQWRCWDHILVNRHMIEGNPASVLENSLVVSATAPGASDHCAVGVRFSYDT